MPDAYNAKPQDRAVSSLISVGAEQLPLTLHRGSIVVQRGDGREAQLVVVQLERDRAMVWDPYAAEVVKLFADELRLVLYDPASNATSWAGVQRAEHVLEAAAPSAYRWYWEWRAAAERTLPERARELVKLFEASTPSGKIA